MENKIKSREIILIQSDTFSQFTILFRETFIYLLFLLLPASFYGCGRMEAPELSEPPVASEYISVKTSAAIEGSILSMDIFSFNDDESERLDSYQRFDEGQFRNNRYGISTSAGRKRIIILANAPYDRYEWMDINCSKAHEKKILDLENEDPEFPLMTADCRIEAGHSFYPQMQALTGEVVLRTLRCDFLEEDYSGEELTDVRIYLTNVSASSGIWENVSGCPSRIINSGRLNMEEVNRFQHPEIIYRSLTGPVGIKQMDPGVRFRAFASNHHEESIGTPFTKLVIEGKIRGNTYYYPIAVNRGPGAKDEGFHRNRRYIYDITITRTGLTDPDGIIQEDFAKIDSAVEIWKEKDWYDVRF